MIPDLTNTKLKELYTTANNIRKLIINMLYEAGSGHTAGPLGMADIFAALYFHILHIDPLNPLDPDRDRLILSNGHICPVLYASLALKGFFSTDELLTLRKISSRLQGHPERNSLPGIENTSGPLGEGLSQSIGIALSAGLDHKSYRVYCIMGDGEQDEGNIWEAALVASKYKLGSITAIIDRNNIQIDGPTEKVLKLEPLKKKYESFGWNVIEIPGHDIKKFIEAVASSFNTKDQPTCIISLNTPGKGISFMENDYKWHGKVPNSREKDMALEELSKLS